MTAPASTPATPPFEPGFQRLSALRLILEPRPLSGALNMARDETLLESVIAGGPATLRIYRWREPTVSLGYFQAEDDPTLGERFGGLPQVRRLSGGGALLHDREVTYSVVCPAEAPFASEPGLLYDAVHAAIVAELNAWGIPARLRGTSLTGAQPFLCFGRGDPRDIVLAGSKIVGSAQRRRKGAVLQHGALLLSRSDWAREFPGLWDLAPEAAQRLDGLESRLGGVIASALSLAWAPGAWRPEEVRDAEAKERERYSSTRPFVARKSSLQKQGETPPD
ncbi:MAG: hypothetical protein KF774_05265 [Planctomyces sp.]|nr:hypothetical protein [Planctomyces sp.]